MALYAFKKHAFVQRGTHEEEDDDDDFEDAVNGHDNEDGPAKKKNKTTTSKHSASDDDDDDGSVEALAPIVKVPAASSCIEDEIIDVEEDEATTRRLNLIREARSACNKLAEAELEELDEVVEEKEKDLGSTLTLSLSCAGEEKVTMKVKSKEPFAAFFRSFAENRGVALSSCSFSFDGEKIKPNQTPESLDMEDEDMLEVSAPPRTTQEAPPAAEEIKNVDEPVPPPPRTREKVSLLLTKAGSKATRITLYDTDKFEKIFKHYSKHKKVQVRLSLEDGTAVLPSHTPLYHRMRGETKISVH